jgi:hypothetical protein
MGVTISMTRMGGGYSIPIKNSEYLYDQTGQMITVLAAGTGAWTRGEVFGQGRHVATYTGTGGSTVFAHSDWLNTERTRTDITGADITADHWTSLPAGGPLKLLFA